MRSDAVKTFSWILRTHNQQRKSDMCMTKSRGSWINQSPSSKVSAAQAGRRADAHTQRQRQRRREREAHNHACTHAHTYIRRHTRTHTHTHTHTHARTLSLSDFTPLLTHFRFAFVGQNQISRVTQVQMRQSDRPLPIQAVTSTSVRLGMQSARSSRSSKNFMTFPQSSVSACSAD